LGIAETLIFFNQIHRDFDARAIPQFKCQLKIGRYHCGCGAMKTKRQNKKHIAKTQQVFHNDLEFGCWVSWRQAKIPARVRLAFENDEILPAEVFGRALEQIFKKWLAGNR
jgi:hypothetical protein